MPLAAAACSRARLMTILRKGTDMNQEDRTHLKILAVFHYVLGIVAALQALLPSIFVGIGRVYVDVYKEFAAAGHVSKPHLFMGWLLVIIGSLAVVLSGSLAVLMIMAGRRLKQHRNRTFCMVVAGLECVLFPYGTVLGILTLIKLSKDSVRSLFTTPARADTASAADGAKLGA